VGQILRAREEADKRPALLGGVIANGPPQYGIARLERIEDRALAHLTLDFQADLAVDVHELPQVGRQQHPDHSSVCTSTDSTAGRSRTMGAQLSPASADA
jgi:hypothetical protein